MKDPRYLPDELFERIGDPRHRGARRDFPKGDPRRLPRCRGKYSYPTEQDALQVRDKNLKRGTAPYLRVYSCDRCRYFHLTHKPIR